MAALQIQHSPDTTISPCWMVRVHGSVNRYRLLTSDRSRTDYDALLQVSYWRFSIVDSMLVTSSSMWRIIDAYRCEWK